MRTARDCFGSAIGPRPWLLAVGLLLPAAGAMPARAQEPAPRATLELSSYRIRESAAHRLTFDVHGGDAEISHAIVDYPAGFSIRGFPVSAAAPTAVGAYELDVGAKGTADRVFPVLASHADRAWVDVVTDGLFDASVEPGLRVSATSLELSLPFGGDANPETVASLYDARVTLVLARGLIVNPTLGGRYRVSAQVASVDPDTDGPDDGAGTAPVVQTIDLPIDIDGPGLVPLSAFTVHKIDLDLRRRSTDRFLVLGRYRLGTASSALDIGSEHVTVVVGSFTQTIPGSAFVRSGPAYLYRGSGPGIRHFLLLGDGHFVIEARDLHLNTDLWRGRRLAVGLRIGNHLGETTVPARLQGHPF